jgi:hypothetical protein
MKRCWRQPYFCSTSLVKGGRPWRRFQLPPNAEPLSVWTMSWERSRPQRGVGQQSIAKQQGVGGIVDRRVGQPGAALGHHAGGELIAGQAEGDQGLVGRQIDEVLNVDL